MRFGAALWAVSALSSAVLAEKDEASRDDNKWEVRAVMTNQLLHIETVSAECEQCCTYSWDNVTVHSTVYSTITVETELVTTVTDTVTVHDTVTDQATVTQHDISTKLEYTTEFVTTTTTSTFATSFPVTVTSVRNCSPRSKRQDNDPDAYDLDRLAQPDTHHCETVTTTEWRTTTTTEAVTVVTPSITTKTVVVPTISVVPTTVENTRTLTQVHTSPTTVWLPTTFTKTATVSTEYPVTITSDHTVVTTSISTEYITTVSTFTSSYPVVTQITKTATVTAPGQLTTLTLPGETKTLPGSTILSTVTNNLPGTTEVVTTTVVVPPTTVIVPPGTVTVTPIFNVTLCPSPTGSSAPLPTDSDLTFGCKPGYVCNPQKPQGCNFWPEPPSKDYLCNPQDCIRSPPFTKVDWRKNETQYYPPSYGYFNLDPEAFGLSYDIFNYHVYEEVKDGCTETITTGNWASQTSLSEWPRHTTKSTSVPAPPSYGNARRELHAFGKRDVTPSLCFDNCNNALLYAESVGKTDALCKAGSQFLQGYNDCAACILNNTVATKLTIRDYVQPQFAQFLDYCSGKQAVATSSAPAGPESEVLTLPTLGTSAQAGTSQVQFTPVVSTAAAASSNAAGSTNPSQSGNAGSSAAGASSAGQGSSAATQTGGADAPTKGATAVTTQATALPAAGTRSGSAVSGGQQSATDRNGAGGGGSPSGTGAGGLPGSGSKTAPHASGQTSNPAVVNGTASTSQPAVITAAAPRLAAGGATIMMISLPMLAAFFA